MSILQTLRRLTLTIHERETRRGYSLKVTLEVRR